MKFVKEDYAAVAASIYLLLYLIGTNAALINTGDQLVQAIAYASITTLFGVTAIKGIKQDVIKEVVSEQLNEKEPE